MRIMNKSIIKILVIIIVFIFVISSIKSCIKREEDRQLARMLEEQTYYTNKNAAVSKIITDVEKNLLKTNFSIKKDFLRLVAFISYGAKTDEMEYKLDSAMSQSIREEEKTKYMAYVIKEYTKELKDNKKETIESFGKSNYQKKNQIVKQLHAFDMNAYHCTTLIAEYRQVIKNLMKTDRTSTDTKLQLKKAEDAIENITEIKSAIRNLHSEVLDITKSMN